MKKNIHICTFFLLFTGIITAQDVNIISQLQSIESGQIEEVKEELKELKLEHPGDPNVIFLEAVLTEDGEEANKFYEAVYSNFPKSQFADAALFRTYSYYFALGLYKKAEELKDQLFKNYPNSPYLNNTSRTFPMKDDMIVVSSKPKKIQSQSDIRYTIQAGAFGQYDNATNLNKKFLDAGLESQIILRRVNNLQLHVVLVGNFSNRNDAVNFLDTFNKNYSLNGRIIEVE